MGINARARNVLGQVVKLHYTTCEPVGSKLISKTRTVPFSPATIRNIMVSLEDWGYLSQPHTSAGRLPTDLGYRTYVNGLELSHEELAGDERMRIDRALQAAPAGPSTLKAVADVIHERTQQMTFHLPLRQSGVKLRHIHLERLNKEHLLALWIARGGQTFETVLPLTEDQLGGAMTEKTANYVNQAFRNHSLVEIARLLTGPNSRAGMDLLTDKTALLTRALMQQAGRLDDLTFQGITQLLEMPEFQSAASVKMLLRAVENKAKIQAVVRRALEVDALVLFYIGGEMDDPDLQNLTLAVAKLNHNHNCIGCVGVLGPKRMPYLKSLQMLTYAQDRTATLPA